MKKLLPILLMAALVIALAACSSNNSEAPETPQAPEPSKNEYLEEFPYIPAQEGMILEYSAEGEEDDFSDATYTLENVSADTFLSNYKEALIADGWEVTEEQLPETLSVKKEDKIAIFLLSESDDGILLMILTK